MKRPPRFRGNLEYTLILALRNYFSDLAPLHVGVDRPDNFPDVPLETFVVLFRNGGSNDTLVTESVTIEVESWANTYYSAMLTMNVVSNVLEGMSFTNGFREITEDRPPSPLDTGVKGWRRYVTSFTVEQRTR